ncbi:MAG: AAA family ATPase, partial [Solirubrobacteraceae bacterium]
MPPGAHADGYLLSIRERYRADPPLPTRIQLCGDLELELESRRVDLGAVGRDARLVLAHLVAHRTRAVERTELAALLAGGDAALESALARLRHVLGDHLTRAGTAVSLLLPPDAWVDVEVAERAALAAELAFAAGDGATAFGDAQTSVVLLEAPYLPEFDTAAVHRRRRQLQDVRCSALHRLAAAALALDPPELAVAERSATELTVRQPYRQAGFELLMDALARQGRRAEALQVYDTLVARLRDELGAEPGPAVRRLRRKLAQGEGRTRSRVPPDASTPVPMPLPPLLARMERRPFVDREPVMERLREWWAEAQLGEGALVLIGGEAGMGKTRLVARMAAEAHADGAAVLYGRADEEPVRAYQPFAQALRHLLAHWSDAASGRSAELTRLLPELAAGEPSRSARSDGERRRHRLFDAVADLVRSAAAVRPLVLVVEDLHWADAPTLLLLREVVRIAPECRLLILATWRDDEVEPGDALSRLLVELRREDLLHRVSLGGLDEPDIAALAAREADGDAADADADATRQLQEQTGGNPFFIEELLRSRREAPDAPPPVPEGVKQVIGRRLARLPDDTVEVLITAAFLGADFSLATLMAVAGDVDVVAAVEHAVRAGLLTEEPDSVDRLSFTHALVRETLSERPIMSRRLRIHRALAEALEAAPLDVPPAQLAHHYFIAREVGGAAKALVYALRAADVALEAHAYEDAAAHYERALVTLDLARPDDRVARADLLLALGRARWQASERGPRLAFEMAAVLARDMGDAERLAWAALGAGGRYYAPGVPDRPYVALLEEALAALEPDDSALRARLLARLAENLVFLEQRDRAILIAGEAQAMARRLGEPAALAAALMSMHATHQHIAYVAERHRLAEEAIALAGELDDDELAALGRHWLVFDLVELGDLVEARRRWMELETLADRLRQPLYRHSALAWRGVWAGLAGRFEEAERLAHASVALAEHAGDPDAQAHFTAQLFAVRREQGRLHELLDPIAGAGAGDGPVALHWRAMLALAHVDAGNVTAARAVVTDALSAGVPAIPQTMLWLSTLVALAEATAALTDAASAEALYPALLPYAHCLAQTGFTGCAGSVERVLGRLAATLDRPRAAQGHLDAALARHEAIGARALAARTRCDLGEILLTGTADARARAASLLADAAAAAR